MQQTSVIGREGLEIRPRSSVGKGYVTRREGLCSKPRHQEGDLSNQTVVIRRQGLCSNLSHQEEEFMQQTVIRRL